MTQSLDNDDHDDDDNKILVAYGFRSFLAQLIFWVNLRGFKRRVVYNVTLAERPAWVCNRRVLSRMRCRWKKRARTAARFLVLHTRDYRDVSRLLYSLAVSPNRAVRRDLSDLRKLQKRSLSRLRLCTRARFRIGMFLRLTGQGRGVDIERGERSLTVAFVSHRPAALGERAAQGWPIDQLVDPRSNV